MLVFGIEFDVVTVVLALAVLVGVLFIQSLIIILVLADQMNKNKMLAKSLEKVAENIEKVKRN